VKVDERRFWHGTPILDLAQDRTPAPGKVNRDLPGAI
jgi:hypothetical protein